MDAPPADPYEGMLLYDEPGVRAFEFGQRVHALAHFLRATQGAGAVISALSKRAPELRHVRRWLGVLFQGPREDVSNGMAMLVEREVAGELMSVAKGAALGIQRGSLGTRFDGSMQLAVLIARCSDT